jgi:hypothetical protein
MGVITRASRSLLEEEEEEEEEGGKEVVTLVCGRGPLVTSRAGA